MKILRFGIWGGRVVFGKIWREKMTLDGCNEPYKGRYWCPEKKWFIKASCPFANRKECNSFKRQCGKI